MCDGKWLYINNITAQDDFINISHLIHKLLLSEAAQSVENCTDPDRHTEIYQPFKCDYWKHSGFLTHRTCLCRDLSTHFYSKARKHIHMGSNTGDMKWPNRVTQGGQERFIERVLVHLWGTGLMRSSHWLQVLVLLHIDYANADYISCPPPPKKKNPQQGPLSDNRHYNCEVSNHGLKWGCMTPGCGCKDWRSHDGISQYCHSVMSCNV